MWFISAFWLALSWLIVFATKSGMVAVMVLPIVNAAMFIIVVTVVSALSSLANMVYILWDIRVYPCCPAVLRSCCARMCLVYAAAMKVLRARYVFGSNDHPIVKFLQWEDACLHQQAYGVVDYLHVRIWVTF
jgi:hypothetical protein